MMPFALALLWLEWQFLCRVLLVPDAPRPVPLGLTNEEPPPAVIRPELVGAAPPDSRRS
jgi:hypothetical protein